MSCSLHDAARFEALGLPVAVIATEAFVRPADEQLAALNFRAYRPHLVVIPHPLAGLTRPLVAARAAAALPDVLCALLDPASVERASMAGAPGTAEPQTAPAVAGGARAAQPEADDPVLRYQPVYLERLDALGEAPGSSPARPGNGSPAPAARSGATGGRRAGSSTAGTSLETSGTAPRPVDLDEPACET